MPAILSFIPRMQHGVLSVSPPTLHPQLHTAFSKPPVTSSIVRGVQRICEIRRASYSEMVEHIQQIISEYQQRIVEMPYVLKRSYWHTALGINGGVNMVFLTFIFSDKDLDIQFL